jgi:hypothetical protein
VKHRERAVSCKLTPFRSRRRVVGRISSGYGWPESEVFHTPIVYLIFGSINVGGLFFSARPMIELMQGDASKAGCRATGRRAMKGVE